MRESLKEVHIFIEMMVKSLILMYSLEIKQNEMKRDLIVNLITNQVIKSETYFLIFNFFAALQRNEILALSDIMGN